MRKKLEIARLCCGAFDDRLVAVDEFHHVSVKTDYKFGQHLGQFIARDKVHMTASYFRRNADAMLAPQDAAKFDTVTCTHYQQLNGYEFRLTRVPRPMSRRAPSLVELS